MAARKEAERQLRRIQRLRRQDEARRQEEWAQFQRWVDQKIGTTPRSRLKWFLEEFLRADLATAGDREWAEWKALLDGFTRWGALRWLSPRRLGEGEMVVVTPGDRKALRRLSRISRAAAFALKAGLVDSVQIWNTRWTATPEVRAEIASSQKSLRGIFEGLARSRQGFIDLGTLKLLCRIGPEVLGSHGPRRLVRYFEGGLLARVLLAALEQLQAVGADRLRVCPFQEPGAVVIVTGQEGCGRLFLAAKGQRYCSREHAVRASYLRWKDRGFPRGTGRRRGGRGA